MLALSIDIESYGACEKAADGTLLPKQTCFHPLKCIHHDKVSPEHLILTCAVTIAESEIPCPLKKPSRIDSLASSRRTGLARSPASGTEAKQQTARGGATRTSSTRGSSSTGWSAPGAWLSSLSPGRTVVLNWWEESHRRALRRLLWEADVLLGMNLPYDFTNLRHYPGFNKVLGHQWVIDVSWLNFLQCEVTPERSLKDIGPALGIYRYDEDKTVRGGRRFPHPEHADHREYNASDTHNSIIGVAELSRAILEEFPASDKLSPYCIKHFSELAWSVVRMQEAGVPLSIPALKKVEKYHSERTTKFDTLLKEKHGLVLHGKGSQLAKDQFLGRVYNRVDNSPEALAKFGVVSIHEHPIVGHTKELHKLQVTKGNRSVAIAALPSDDKDVRALRRWNKRDESNNIVSRYTYPLLRHKRNEKAVKPLENKIIRGIAPTRSVGLAFPSFYMVPGSVKDTSDSTGGQKQGRLSARSPAVTTFPAEIKKCVQSRWGDEGAIIGADLSQIELRTAALHSGDETLLRNYREGRDLHSDRAVYVFGPDIVNDPGWRSGDMRDDPRQWSKTLNFEDLYLAGARKMQSIMLEDSGRLFSLDFFHTIESSRSMLRPGLWDWQQRMIAEALRVGALILPVTGHSRWFLGAEKPNEIVNFPIQTTAAITMLAIQRRLHRLLPPLTQKRPDIYLFTNWYDAAYFDVKRLLIPDLEAMFAEAVEYVEKREYWAWMQEETGNEVPLKYEIKEHAA